MTSENKATRIAEFLRREKLAVTRVARAAEMSAPHLFDILAGRTKEPKASTIERLRRAASQLLERDVFVAELFDLGDPPRMQSRAARRRG